jgi:hypothetical protein
LIALLLSAHPAAANGGTGFLAPLSGSTLRWRVQGKKLDHGKLRGAQRARMTSEAIDLGNEPPLSVDGDAGGIVDRRRVSVQWFSGTILKPISPPCRRGLKVRCADRSAESANGLH